MPRSGQPRRGEELFMNVLITGGSRGIGAAAVGGG